MAPCLDFSEFERGVKDPEVAWASSKWPECAGVSRYVRRSRFGSAKGTKRPGRLQLTSHLNRPTMIDNAHDTEVLEPEPIRQGGLQRDVVSTWILKRNSS